MNHYILKAVNYSRIVTVEKGREAESFEEVLEYIRLRIHVMIVTGEIRGGVMIRLNNVSIQEDEKKKEKEITDFIIEALCENGFYSGLALWNPRCGKYSVVVTNNEKDFPIGMKLIP